MADRARRDRQSKSDKFAALKLARQGGRREWKGEEADIYDEVTEDQYKSVVQGRLAKDDFVVDDGVGGYLDNGMDDWENVGAQEDSEDEPKPRTTKSSQASKKQPAPTATTSLSAYRPAVSKEQEDAFISGLLDVLDQESGKPSSYRYDDRSSSPGPSVDKTTAYSRSGHYSHRDPFADTSSDGPPSDGFDLGVDLSSDDGLITSPKKKVRTEVKGIAPAIEKMGAMEVAGNLGTHEDDYFDDIPFDDLMDTDEKPTLPIKAEHVDVELPKVPVHDATVKKEENTSWLSVYDSLTVKSDDNFGKLGSGAVASSSSAHAATISALEDDGSFRFFWLDYLEQDGALYFVGKTLDKKTNSYVSCCVTVTNLQRNLFVLPRPYQLDHDGFETDIVPDMPAVWRDFDQIRKKAGIKGWKAKFVKRRYAFGESDVPREETQWLKVVYGFEEPQIPANVSSPTFSRIFGTNTNAFELLVLKRKIMGPCWLQIKKPHVEYKGVSWCKFEVTVEDPKDINPFAETDPNAPRDTPPLTIASLSIRTIVNHHENIREIALPCTVHTLVRPLGRFPPGFEAKVKSNAKGLISPMNNERMLLNSFLVTLHKADPDIIVGHDFVGVSLDILLHRMRDLKADHWSRIGRFRRTKWPGIGRQGTNLRFLYGRLVCDLASDGAKSMISSTTWSLTEMCSTHLKNARQDIDPADTPSYFDDSVSTPDRLITFVRHCELDAHYQMAIAAKVQILPLTRQLTNLAGNSWNKTLNGGRAERNEYILLHEFHRLKYIRPDKQWGKKAAPVKVEQDEDGEGGESKTSKGKRDKYKGGLVFEPKRGLWDKFILVMDFNSLYPSIIQEYNIDFTTVDLQDSDEDKIPEPPASEVPQGVLPRLIATLVSRRRQVKGLMKDRSLSPAKLLQYDIKQQALKLTANSMYGCLGFEYSRFYAKPLAALTTFKGREILTHTRELAESLQLDVIYGDTDSVFVNSNVTELSEALKISAELKKAVNDRYKLLEIDLDGVFQRLLLLQKKKYAAVKVEDGLRSSIEVKGLDMKRREYCSLSKTVSQYLLDQILSGEATEVVVERIHEYLTTISDDIRCGKIKLDEFIIHKRLGKNPEDYPDAKSQPHVQVALRMKTRNVAVRAGDVIPYIFCCDSGDGEGKGNTSQAERAKHPDELRKAGTEFQTDYEYYLAHQILPPIERLCDPIEGTDRARLAECLGLDPGRYRSTTVTEFEERRFSALESQLPDSERYKDAAPFVVRCRACECNVGFAPVSNRAESLVKAKGVTCPMCAKSLGTASLQIQLECQIRSHIHRYYEGWTICNDSTCGNRARMMGVYGRRCLKSWCQGQVSFEYSDSMLYNQLRYFLYLFDIEKGRASNPDEMLNLAANHGDFLQRMRQTVEKYLEFNGRRWVDMDGLFSFMKL
ncbi:DNA polymerase alpha catalytic subunit [Russula aff. rugulosa BPL654]|nr:DNA polymerase alpha catalytic subunit [Russula aff. rugulosa BPL654]